MDPSITKVIQRGSLPDNRPMVMPDQTPPSIVATAMKNHYPHPKDQLCSRSCSFTRPRLFLLALGFALGSGGRLVRGDTRCPRRRGGCVLACNLRLDVVQRFVLYLWLAKFIHSTSLALALTPFLVFFFEGAMPRMLSSSFSSSSASLLSLPLTPLAPLVG